MRTDSPTSLIGTFLDASSLLAATRAARVRGIAVADAYTPFAVHGLDEAAGLPSSRLPVVCFALGLAGMSAAMAFQVWASAVDWPVNIGGKSFTALPALVPIAFEVTVLAAALGTVAAFLARARLWPGQEPQATAERVTDDRFALELAVSDGDRAAARELLLAAGALEVQEASR